MIVLTLNLLNEFFENYQIKANNMTKTDFLLYQHQNEVIEMKHIEIVKEMKEENRKLQTEIALLKTSNEELKKQNCHLTEELQKQFNEPNTILETQHSKSTETNTQQLSKFDNLQQNQSTILNLIQQIYNNSYQSFPVQMGIIQKHGKFEVQMIERNGILLIDAKIVRI